MRLRALRSPIVKLALSSPPAAPFVRLNCFSPILTDVTLRPHDTMLSACNFERSTRLYIVSFLSPPTPTAHLRRRRCREHGPLFQPCCTSSACTEPCTIAQLDPLATV